MPLFGKKTAPVVVVPQQPEYAAPIETAISPRGQRKPLAPTPQSAATQPSRSRPVSPLPLAAEQPGALSPRGHRRGGNESPTAARKALMQMQEQRAMTSSAPDMPLSRPRTPNPDFTSARSKTPDPTRARTPTSESRSRSKTPTDTVRAKTPVGGAAAAASSGPPKMSEAEARRLFTTNPPDQKRRGSPPPARAALSEAEMILAKQEHMKAKRERARQQRLKSVLGAVSDGEKKDSKWVRVPLPGPGQERIGLFVKDLKLGPNKRGIYVSNVERGYPADLAGFHRGDKICSIRGFGTNIPDWIADLRADAVSAEQVAKVLGLMLTAHKQNIAGDLDVRFEIVPDALIYETEIFPPADGKIGAMFDSDDLIMNVEPGSHAEDQGLRKGMHVEEINGCRVSELPQGGVVGAILVAGQCGVPLKIKCMRAGVLLVLGKER